MATTYFKRLFEIRILHEYFLLDARHPEFFALNDQDREVIVNNKLRQNQYNIWKYLSIEPAEETIKLLNGQHLKFITQPTGFFIGMEVKPTGEEFIPFIPLDRNVDFTFLLKIKDPYVKNYTSLRLKSAIPAIYFFTNVNPNGKKAFPALSEPVTPFQMKNFYEMGEMAMINGNIKEALERTKSTHSSRWRDVNGKGFANEADRILVPHQFYYGFEKEQEVSQCEFTLKTLEGGEVKTITVNGAEKINKAFLDFRQDQKPVPEEIPDGLYDLEVKGDNDFQVKSRLYLHSNWYNSAFLGVISISNAEEDPDFNLLGPVGNLKKPYPVFEIRLRSRITYWRYQVQEKPFKLSDKATNYLKKANGSVQAVNPRSLTLSPIEFKSDDPATTDVNERIFMPNPAHAGIKQEADGRIYSDIYISLIKDLIIKE